MINDSNPYFGRGFQISSAELEEMRRKWRDAGQWAWNAATRLGRDVRARTEAELEALGRSTLAKAEREEARAKAAVKQVATVAGQGLRDLKAGAQQARGQVKAMTQAVAGAGKAVTQQSARGTQLANNVLAELPASILRLGTEADPGPGRLLSEWALSSGPDTRTLGPQSSFSREFASAPGVQMHVQRALAHAQERPGGWNANGGQYSGYAAEYHKPRPRIAAVEDVLAGNGAASVIGSYGLDGEKHGDHVDWSARNEMDTNSFFAGNVLGELGLRGVPQWSPRYPLGAKRQVIQFRTDLEGRPY